MEKAPARGAEDGHWEERLEARRRALEAEYEALSVENTRAARDLAAYQAQFLMEEAETRRKLDERERAVEERLERGSAENRAALAKAEDRLIARERELEESADQRVRAANARLVELERLLAEAKDQIQRAAEIQARESERLKAAEEAKVELDRHYQDRLADLQAKAKKREDEHFKKERELEDRRAFYEESWASEKRKAEGEIESLRLEREKLLLDVRASREQGTGLLARIMGLEREKALVLDEARRAHARELELSMEARAALAAERDDLLARVADLEGERESLRGKLAEQAKTAAALRQDGSLAAQEHARTLDELNGARSAHEKERSALLAELAGLRVKAEGHHPRVLELERRLALAEDAASRTAALEEEARRWREDLHKMEDEQAALRGKLAEQAQAAASLRQDHSLAAQEHARTLDELKGAGSAHEKERAALLAELADLRVKAEGHHPRVLELERRLALAEDAASRTEALEEQAGRWRETLKNLEAEYDSLRRDHSGLLRAREALEADRAVLLAEVADLAPKAKGHHPRVLDLERRLAAAEERLSRVSGLEEQSRNWQPKLRTLEAELEALRRDQAAAEEMNLRREGELARISEERVKAANARILELERRLAEAQDSGQLVSETAARAQEHRLGADRRLKELEQGYQARLSELEAKALVREEELFRRERELEDLKASLEKSRAERILQAEAPLESMRRERDSLAADLARLRGQLEEQLARSLEAESLKNAAEEEARRAREAAAQALQWKAAVGAKDQDLSSLRRENSDLSQASAAHEKERAALLAELADLRVKAEGHHPRVLELERRLAAAEEDARRAETLAAQIEEWRGLLQTRQTGLDALRAQNAELAQAVGGTRRDNSEDLERQAGQWQAALAAKDRELEELRRERDAALDAKTAAQGGIREGISRRDEELKARARELDGRQADIEEQARTLAELAREYERKIKHG